MIKNYIGISIPLELQQFQKVVKTIDYETEQNEKTQFKQKVEFIKNPEGQIIEVIYYSDTGGILKKVCYSGSSVCLIEYYKQERVRAQEYYDNGRIIRKCFYNKSAQIDCKIDYEYNRQGLIISIRKQNNSGLYEVNYGYDELKRINTRIIKYNKRVISSQKYRYDIIDRITEYEDENQKIIVHKMNPENALIRYSIFDRARNMLQIFNKFINNKYIDTEVDLNGHKTTVIEPDYTDSIFLKKPSASEFDIEFAISCTFNAGLPAAVKRGGNNDILDVVIDSAKIKPKIPILFLSRKNILPISVRKINLIKNSA